MGKTGKWFKSFLVGKKDKGDTKDQKKNVSETTSITVHHRNTATTTTPKEKKRWSFRRSSASNTATNTTTNNYNHASASTKAAAAAADESAQAATMAAEEPKVAPNVVRDTEVEDSQGGEVGVVVVPTNQTVTVAVTEEAAAVQIQAVYRSYLARKALKALRGLVKLQALVRGHLVRKQATATLRCMQALMTAQARVRAQRFRSGDEMMFVNHRQSTQRPHYQDTIKHSNYDMEENIKIVEMDHGEFGSKINSRISYSIPSQHQIDDRLDNRMPLSPCYSSQEQHLKQDYQHYSPAPSAITDFSPRTCSGHFEDYSIPTAQSSPQCYSVMSRPDPSRAPFDLPKPEFAETMSYDFPLYPNYMSNTQSSRAKVRSQSAPKQRPELERQPSRGRRPSVEGRNIPKGSKMQRSSSQAGPVAQDYHYPWSVRLDKSTISLRDSECGSTYSVATNAYYRSIVSYDVSYDAKDC